MTAIVRKALFTAILAVAGAAAAQSDPLFTRKGWEVGGQVSKYYYEEPNFAQNKGERIGVVGAYNFTSITGVYSRIDGRFSYGSLDYTGSGTATHDDYTTEARAVVGKDYLVRDGLVLSPYIGFGYRYLYNDARGVTSTGAIGYRRYSHYAYMPVGMTVRMNAGGLVLAPTLEYDAFLGGRQYSKLSDTGLGLGDASNKQSHGRGYRAYLMAEKGNWSVGPWIHYWKIEDSDIVVVAPGVAGLEPANWTREYGIEVRYRF